ncbi:MAG TPA: methylated-DNA--[protein]-cysteine S-methyltransferase [Candidatus Acidoferrales bacterium]|nr:methylated-DNA--[protein]-cysteine S-methyltransferase [Candidatus Acidoferrales bacterium]
MTDYERIAKAISYINEHFREQPDLDHLADVVHLSKYHFHRLFKKWAGVSPKKFLEYISVEHAKSLLRQSASLAETSYQLGLSGTGRLHDLFINIERMTPGEFKNKGENLVINYEFYDAPFGKIIMASTPTGLCHIGFANNEQRSVRMLREKYTNASLIRGRVPFHQNALKIFQDDWKSISKIKLHLKATPFQLKVWEALLKIPFGEIRTYSQVADEIGRPTASRAVGAAIGSNPVAYLIPCHRVIKSTGVIGDYHWGNARKAAIVGWEAAKTYGEN